MSIYFTAKDSVLLFLQLLAAQQSNVCTQIKLNL